MDTDSWRSYAPELLGTFVLVFVGTTAVVAAGRADAPVLLVAPFAFGLAQTAIFVLVILQASRSERFGSSALVAIPLTLLAVHLAAIPFSGSSVNPARTFGPDLVGNTWTGIWVYFAAPPLGAALAWAIHAGVVSGKLGPPLSPVAEVLEESPTGAARDTA